MKNLFWLLLAVLILPFVPVSAQRSEASGSPVVPLPVSTKAAGDGKFVFAAKTVISYEVPVMAQAKYLAETLFPSTGLDLKVQEGKGGSVRLSVDTLAVPHAEGYILRVSPKRIDIVGHDPAGVFYGIQTLLQYLPPAVYSRSLQRGVEWTVPAVEVEDAPDHPWRGMLLDAARYYYDKSFVKKFIDMMAMYKLNKLQFHLIDDSGWRLEIKKYPRLTEVGAWAGTGEKRIGGYYTQDDIRELVAYAQVRGVEIVPEIEFPAHILSAVAAYPWLCCTGQQHEVQMQHFISRDLLCVGKETSLQFLRDVLDETLSLFPSRYINIGGDEAVYTRWEQCPDCQALMKREGLTKASELQGWLTNLVAQWMKERGRTVIGWEEIIMRGKVSTPVVALTWHNVADTARVIPDGHKTILTPCTHLYLDFPESGNPGEPKHATWMPPIPLRKTYTMPLNDYSPQSATIGVQGCIWSDQFIHGDMLREILPIDENRSEKYVEYFCMPRMQALSELGWCRASRRDYADFCRRMSSHYARLDAKECGYRVPEPEVASETLRTDGTKDIILKCPVGGARVRYTIDGTWPTVHSPLYQGEAIHVASRSDLMAITEVTPIHYSLPLYTAPDYTAYSRYGTFTAQWRPLQLQSQPAPWRFECTGKVNGNGKYEVTFLVTHGKGTMRYGALKVLKRDEVVATVAQPSIDGAVVTYAFEISAFEAGTPFFIEVEASVAGVNDTSGLVFVRKTE